MDSDCNRLNFEDQQLENPLPSENNQSDVLIIELAADCDQDQLNERLFNFIEQENIDATIATSETQYQHIWKLRELATRCIESAHKL